MDQLPQLVKTLRVSARTNEPNRVALVEKAIDGYLNDKAGIVRLSLERLWNAIENMLIETPSGFDYTGADCAGWMKEIGFRKTYVEHLIGSDSMVVGIK